MEIAKEESTQVVLLSASGTGQSYALEDMNGGPDTKLEPEEQIKKEAPRHEDERLKDKGIGYSELLKQLAQLREQNARLELHIEELEKQLAEKEEQIIRFRNDIDNLTKVNLPKLFQELQQMFDSDHLGLLDAKDCRK